MVSRTWVAAGLWFGLAACPALGQDMTSRYSPLSRTDAYGNAQPTSRLRRAMGTFQNRAQRDAVRGYQMSGRRAGRRGGLIPFALPRDRSWRPGPGRFTGIPEVTDVLPTPIISPWQRQAFRHYGGFARRAPERDAGSMAAVLSRRGTLLLATAQNAPVRRAQWQLVAAAIIERPGDDVPLEPEEEVKPFEPTTTMTEALHEGVVRSHEWNRDRAWNLLAEGEYRLASRTFEAAILLDSEDYEARIGEIFCQLSLSAMRTAASLVEQLARRDPNPFAHDVRLADRYPDGDDLREMRLAVQLFARRNSDVVLAEALRIFVLWHLDERDEAILLATSSSRELTGTAFGDWPVRIREAPAARSGEIDQP